MEKNTNEKKSITIGQLEIIFLNIALINVKALLWELKFCLVQNCGKKIKVQASRLKKSIHGNVFCSKNCAASFNNTNYRCGEKNPNHKGTYYGSYRLLTFANQEHKCAVCGWDKDERVLQVHHIDEDRSNNDLSNLIILCPTCHCFLTLHLYTLEELRNLF